MFTNTKTLRGLQKSFSRRVGEASQNLPQVRCVGRAGPANDTDWKMLRQGFEDHEGLRIA